MRPIREGDDPFSPEPSGVFGSIQSSFVTFPMGTAGTVAMNFGGEAHTLTAGRDPEGAVVEMTGLPTVGFVAYSIVNSNAQQGILANYGGVAPIRKTAKCTGDADGCR